MVSQLAINVIETGDPRSLRILDSSVYNPELEVSCEQLHITPPGFTYPAGFDVEKGFNTVFTSESLGLTDEGTPISNLPEGVYIIRYSINPNERVWVEYYYLRNTAQLQRYYNILCKLNLQPCDNVDKDMESTMKAVYTAKIYIDAAKSMVEYCNAPKKGVALYDYAGKLLDKIEKKIGSCKNC